MQIPSIADSFPSNEEKLEGIIWVQVDAEYKIACDRQKYWSDELLKLMEDPGWYNGYPLTNNEGVSEIN